MKKLIFIFLLFVPLYTWAQGKLQRLGINPTIINLSKSTPLGSAKTFCSDGTARGIESKPGEFIHFQSPETIKVLVNGSEFPGGLPKLISDKDVIVNNNGQYSVDFKLRKTSKYETVKIEFKEPNLVANKAGDFVIEEQWLTMLHQQKILPTETVTFKEAAPYLKEFQVQNGLKQEISFQD